MHRKAKIRRKLWRDRATTAEATFTIHVFLSNDVVKELCVVGVHPPTSWTGHHLLLGVATQVLSKLWAPFNCGFTI